MLELINFTVCILCLSKAPQLRYSLSVAKAKTTIPFIVELTSYGWSLQAAGKKIGLFQTQQQALAEVKRRRAELTARGKHSSVAVVGGERGEPGRTRSTRPFWSSR